ncbi:uncharacterized protein LOC109608574 [Aethina tumida]|uniref:uncharacterized protein LOC109608574 n=1 Tax=Aethina tumida TaxID=116153 RepID=UPI00096ADB2E|nr:uncharacterized protein LOC109608574 [Aethina tumida]XP_049821545.1 uncharacterized protein LOC109608574 [Aethina tumida]XP_049821546.1 uncharacterized protein LOC109608574 [Aethina tumida]XP_049821548.1 uncharacterized protein LOC109608574 [Aethina tumida]XP_049821549.1 uncharacterized protein LOC109608574 [Aethina tumida]
MYQQLIIIAVFLFVRISGSALHGSCLINEDCGTIDTYCKDGVCSCKPNFIVWYDSCLQITTPPMHCRKKDECQNVLGARSLCTRNNVCACRPFHHLHNGQCVKNRDLHDICEHDHQCYCGVDCGDKIACIGRNCTCKPGHKAYRSRRCISIEPVHTVVQHTNLVGGSTSNKGLINILTLFLFIRLFVNNIFL